MTTRRGFLLGAASSALTAALPAPRVAAAVGGTVTGRFTTGEPAIYEISRSEIKRLVFARAYGGEYALEYDADRGPVGAFLDLDLASIEARVLAQIRRRDIEGLDPYDPEFAVKGT